MSCWREIFSYLAKTKDWEGKYGTFGDAQIQSEVIGMEIKLKIISCT